MLLVFEAGLSINTTRLKPLLFRSILVAITGTVLPILIGVGILKLFRYDTFQSVITSSSLASTSIGITIILLKQQNMLQSDIGTLITSAAMLDDVLSLMLLSIVEGLSPESSTRDLAMHAFRPAAASFCTLIIGLILAFLLPKLVALLRVKLKITDHVTDTKFSYFILLFMILYGVTASFLSSLAGSTFLLGSFISGTSFIHVPLAVEIWEEHVAKPQAWLLSLFFASVGFGVPISSLFNYKYILYGLAFTLGAFISKLAAGVFASSGADRLIVGIAMVGRGEVGLLMVTSSFNKGKITKDLFAIGIWAILLNTLLSPFLFNAVLKWKIRRQPIAPEEVISSQVVVLDN